MDTARDETEAAGWQPSVVNLYTDDAILVLRRSGNRWTARRCPHRMGRPLMEPLVWNATSGKPFGRSRLKKPIRTLIDDYVRTVANASIALEFDTTPQKYLLGVTDEQYDAIVAEKFKTYVGSLLTATANPETGENPTFGQLAQGSLTPHVEKMRMTATQFAAATGLTVMDVGIVNDANPTSSDAILAQSQTLVLLAQAAEHRQQGRAADHHPHGAGHRPVGHAGGTHPGGAGRDGAFQEPGHALGGGDGGRGHQDRLRPAGVRRHGHVPGNGRL